jgi:ATP-dependent Zn protease
MPRGDALGLVYQLPKGDQNSLTRRQMIARLDVFMGGRVAEELVFGPDSVSSGASSDIQQATNLARAMVSQWGFSDAVGKVYHDAQVSSVSDETRVLIDKETRRLIDESYARVTELLRKHSKEHERLSLALIDFESLTGKECLDIVEKNVRPSRKIVNTRGGAKNDITVLDERGKVTASAKSA